MEKNSTIKLLLLGSFLGLISCQSNGQSETNDRKNVVMILVDDLKPALGSYGDETAVSPNIDRLADMGVRFTNAYCNQAVCMASRYNLMLGARSTSTGLYNFGVELRDAYPEAVTLPQHFINAGYHAESMGKVYHIGHGNTNDEASWSIPHHKDKVIEYVEPESTNRQLTREEAFFQNTRMHIPETPSNNELPRGAAWEAPDVLDEAYADGRVARHAIDRLQKLNEEPDQPFFMAVGFVRPHLPFSVPKKYWDMYEPDELPMPQFEDHPANAPKFAGKRYGEIRQFKPLHEQPEIFTDSIKRSLIHGYYASVSYMDAQVGRVIDELERLEMLDNTIIVLWGDHGWHLGDHGYWTKHTNYEQANHIPLLVTAPGITVPGASTGQLAETVDIYPTLAELAGLEKPKAPQPVDGRSLVPVLKDPDQRIRDHAYHAYTRGGYLGRAIRTDKYRLVEWTPRNNSEAEPVYELYDYKDDPLETRNIADDKPDIVASLKEILERHPEALRYPDSGE